jgi:hypothetical protein
MSSLFHYNSWFSLYGIESILTYLRGLSLSFFMVGIDWKTHFSLSLGLVSSLFS